MAEINQLLREYIERFESGGSSDPGDLLARVEGADREKLSVLIQGYLEHAAPAQDWDPDAFEGSIADRAVARVAESWSQASGQLPAELVKLRNERQITRADLVSRLAGALGVSGAREKVAFYYHRMEQGLLPAEGVSGRVWEALAGLLETSADSLRDLGAGTEARGVVASEALYARTAAPPPDEYPDTDAAARAQSPAAATEEPDEVDRLFTGG